MILSFATLEAMADGDPVRCANEALASIELPAGMPGVAPPQMPYERLRVGEVSLGVGHLRPVDEAYLWDWYVRVRVPLFDSPGEMPSLWLVDGWIVPAVGEPSPLGTSGMIETGYETPSFIVLERRSDGWLRLRYAPAEAGGGTAWTHECLLAMGPYPLIVEAWPDRLMSGGISPLFFVAQVPHSLRSGPSIDADRIGVIPAMDHEYQIEPLEVRGDWMRVRVSVPSTYCRGPDAPEPKTHEGWVTWRDDEQGPWLWYYTRGC